MQSASSTGVSSLRKRKALVIVTVVIILALVILGMRYLNTGDRLLLDLDGKLALLHITMFRSEQLRIVRERGEWWTKDASGKEHWLPTPYVSRWNDNGFNLILEHSGRMFVVNQSKPESFEIKFMNGDWCMHPDGGEWVPIDDF